ncbi:MAG: C45 family autoproteolytic acyltransferase/hydrolase [Chlamydiales bacterium]
MFKFLTIVCLVCFATLQAELLERFGKGYLEKEQGQLVLHLEGTAFERGEQHGHLLQALVRQNIAIFLEGKRPEKQKERAAEFKPYISQLLKHTPKHLIEEMRGVAAGAEVPFEKIVALNLFPEMFHCSAITARGGASKDGALYHVRALDYAIGKGIQDSALLMVVTPDEGYSFLNVTYAGFVGSVTGMNSEKIAIGEIGGKGYGSWNGIPMAFLIRMLLENSSSLDDARAMLTNSPRTCEYFYILSDGKTDTSCGVYATADEIAFIEPGASYGDLPAFQKAGIADLITEQPEECLLLTGLTWPERYPVLKTRLEENFGKIDEKILQEIIQGAGGKESNLHNAIFLPSQLKIWISHAGPNDEPAYTQPYAEFSLLELLPQTTVPK